MNIISTWLYLDKKGEESKFPQVGGSSSTTKFQNIYWRCVIVFFSTSIAHNKGCKHMFFTNANALPVLDDLNVKDFFHQNQIEVVRLTNKYKVPKGYYNSWNNQFYEFSILHYLGKNITAPYNLLLLDSDCVFNNSVDSWFKELDMSPFTAFTYTTEQKENQEINGLTPIELKTLFIDLGLQIEIIPKYSGGEVMFVKDNFVSNLIYDFESLWKELEIRFLNKKLKFNEEAHVLSYYYYKYNADIGRLNSKIKRCWTNPLLKRNITKNDYSLDILHLPSEKNFGLKKAFDLIAISRREYNHQKLIKMLLSSRKYYLDPKSIYVALKKFLKRVFNRYPSK